jgi:curli biogenesis system outer membrane secretion channel CsgG
MRYGKYLLLITGALLFLASCATIEKPQVSKVDTGPEVSKTVQAEMEKRDEAGAYRYLKRKVAIARFTNETTYGQSFLLDERYDRIGKQAVDILSAKLMETEKFILLERSDLEKIHDELYIGDGEALKNMADYLIVGSVTEFGRKDEGKVGFFSRTKKQVAFAKVTIRLIDVYTGQILYAEEGEGEAFTEAGTVLGMGGKAGYDSTLNDKALENAIVNLSSNVIENMLDKPWRSYILAYEEGQYIISGGERQGIKPGDEFDIYAQGKKIQNPQTNMFITLPGKKVAKVRVISCAGDTPENEVSFCKLVDGSLPTMDDREAFAKLFVQEIKNK